MIDGFPSSLVENKKESVAIYYYCDYADKRTLTCDALFSCVFQQLLRCIGQLPDGLLDALDAICPDHTILPSLDEIVDLFIIALTSFPMAAIFIDGIDEFPENERKMSLSTLQRVLGLASHPTKLFVSSREDISYLFPQSKDLSTFKVQIRKESIAADVDVYLRSAIKALLANGELRLGDPALADTIFTALSAGAQGM